VRIDDPVSGQWLLKDAKFKAWMDPNDANMPIFWMNGIPGAGMNR
jgi:hypothetical protein